MQGLPPQIPYETAAESAFASTNRYGAMSNFHFFPRLPTELRLRIWELTVEPRTVEVRSCWIDKTCNDLNNLYPPERYRTIPWRIYSPTPIPATLQTCREARNHSLYQQIGSDIGHVDDSGPHYVWLNLDIDILSIGPTRFSCFHTVASRVTRLRFERSHRDDDFWDFEYKQLQLFSNVKEVQVHCMTGLRRGK